MTIYQLFRAKNGFSEKKILGVVLIFYNCTIGTAQNDQ